MIQLWTWPTPNGQKVHIALEELALPYEIVPINIGQGDQFKPEFLAITPNHRIPAIVDPDGPGGELRLFESGAILLYLADKTGQLMPQKARDKAIARQWLMFQMASVGPMFGQHGHFAYYAPEKYLYAIERYTNEMQRILRVLDKRLGQAPWLAGDEYSMADIATFPWTRDAPRRGVDMSALPNVSRWHAALEARPGVQRGLAVMKQEQQRGEITDAQRENLFGKAQFKPR